MALGSNAVSVSQGRAPWPVYVLASVSILLLTAALLLCLRTEWFLHSAVRTVGTFESASSADGRTGTVFHFSTPDGQMVRVVSSVTVRSTGMPGPGDPVPVYYQPANPAKARLGLWAWLWLAPSVLGGLGTGFGLTLIGLRWMAGRGGGC